MFGGECAESTCNNFFFAVVEEHWFVDNTVNLSFIGKSNLLCTSKLSLLSSSNVVSNGNREQVSLANFVLKRVHVQDLEQLHFVHEPIQGIGPAVSNGLKILYAMFVKLESFEASCFFKFSFSGFFDQAADNALACSWHEDVVVMHMFQDHVD